VTRKCVSRLRGEEGTSLVIALAFLALLGASIASMLMVTFSSFKTTQVARSRGNTHYGADGGADLAIQMLRANSSYCPDTAAGTQSLPSQTINGKSVTITCQALSGSTTTSLSPTTYSLIVTGYPQTPSDTGWKLNELFRKEGDAGSPYPTVTIGGGPVFNAGKFYDKFDNNKGIVQFTDNVTQWNSTTGVNPGPHCTDSKAVAATSGNPAMANGATWTCVNQSSYPVPDPNFALIAPSALAPAPVVQGTCTIFFPGRYTTKPATFDEHDHYYFASGVYFFDDVGEVLMEAASAFGGEPAPGESRAFSGITPCATDAVANTLVPGSATGKGALFIMGGNSKWKVHNHSETRFEIFSRVPANPAIEPVAGMSIYAPRFNGSNWTANNPDFFFGMDGSNPQVVIHGLVYAPGGQVNQLRTLANPAAGGRSLFSGGLVVGRFEAKFDGSSTSGKLVQRGDGVAATNRTVVVTATATDPGGAPVTVKAIIDLSSTGATVLSWRKV
jgi:hypothetical protein